MSQSPPEDFSLLLRQARDGDQSVVDRLVPLVYDELRGVAGALLGRERGRISLIPTELVHEAYLRLVDQRKADWHDRAHFFALATILMRRILVDRARRRGARKRGGEALRVSLAAVEPPALPHSCDLLDLDVALTSLEQMDERRAKVASFRIFGGLEPDEIAEVLRVSRRTVERDWLAARAWLILELGDAKRE